MLRDLLRLYGHKVLDWSPLPKPIQPNCFYEDYVDAVKSIAAVNVFSFCTTACTTADTAIYLGPAGADSAAQIMLASITGTPVLGIINKKERPGIMVYHSVNMWVDDEEEAVRMITACDDMSTLLWRCRVCGCTWGRACPSGCFWVAKDLCSECAERTK